MQKVRGNARSHFRGTHVLAGHSISIWPTKHQVFLLSLPDPYVKITMREKNKYNSNNRKKDDLYPYFLRQQRKNFSLEYAQRNPAAQEGVNLPCRVWKCHIWQRAEMKLFQTKINLSITKQRSSLKYILNKVL